MFTKGVWVSHCS